MVESECSIPESIPVEQNPIEMGELFGPLLIGPDGEMPEDSHNG